MTTMQTGGLIALIWAFSTALAEPAPTPDPYAMLRALCMDTNAEPTAVSLAAIANGFTPDGDHADRYLKGVAASQIGVSTNTARVGKAKAKTTGDVEVRVCTLTFKTLPARALQPFWDWLSYNSPPALPWSAYVRTPAEGEHVVVQGRTMMIHPYIVSPQIPNAMRRALKEGKLRLMSVESDGVGGVSVLYGVVSHWPKR
ncbi:hypothetical protein BH11PSE2_BH11PSE2_14470 [soil metagenome]